jgi:hypothetical protein
VRYLKKGSFIIWIFYLLLLYSARRLMGSQMIKSAAYCNQILVVLLYLNSIKNTLVNWIIRLLLSLLIWPKVILLSGGRCIYILFYCQAERPLAFYNYYSESNCAAECRANFTMAHCGCMPHYMPGNQRTRNKTVPLCGPNARACINEALLDHNEQVLFYFSQ